MNRIRLFSLLLVAMTLILMRPVQANDVVTGTIRDCANNPVSGVAVYAEQQTPTGTCALGPSRLACAITDVSGQYSFSISSSPDERKICLIAMSGTDGWGAGCYSCVTYKCCNGSPMALTYASTIITAGANNITYTVNFAMSYSGSCPNNTDATDLRVDDCTMSSVHLSWSGPTDGGCPATAYDVRYSSSPIDDSNWANANQIGIIPGGQSNAGTFWVNGLHGCTWYYFALRGQRHDGNWSNLSNGTSAKTRCTTNGPCQFAN